MLLYKHYFEFTRCFKIGFRKTINENVQALILLNRPFIENERKKMKHFKVKLFLLSLQNQKKRKIYLL